MKKDGGPAFPVSVDRPLVAYSYSGLSLRDYFAGMALQGVARDYGVTAEGRARQCYEYADAMLAERDKP
jgi:hypothetical protein